MSVDSISNSLTAYFASLSGSASSTANSSTATAPAKPDDSELYGKVDTDSDGTVSQDEFLSFIKDIQSKDQESGMDTELAGMTDEELAALYTEGDTDGDGTLSEEEFSAIGESLRPQMPTGGPGGAGGMPPMDSTSGSASTTASGLDISALLEALSSSDSTDSSTSTSDLYAYLSQLIADSYGSSSASTSASTTQTASLDATA